MPELSFEIGEANVVPFAATPMLALALHIRNVTTGENIHTVSLRCQIEIEAARRSYTPEERQRMLDLFGEPHRWSQTLHSLLWTHVNVVVPGFDDSTVTHLHVPCTFDFNVAATKYFAGLIDGDIPLHMMFSGSVFYSPPDRGLQVAPLSWDLDARCKLPVRIWREMMDSYYPNCAWLALRRDVFERLYRYKVRHGIPTWEQALENMLPLDEKEELVAS